MSGVEGHHERARVIGGGNHILFDFEIADGDPDGKAIGTCSKDVADFLVGLIGKVRIASRVVVLAGVLRLAEDWRRGTGRRADPVRILKETLVDLKQRLMLTCALKLALISWVRTQERCLNGTPLAHAGIRDQGAR